ncbi:MAG: DUF192 domain-containing protein [Candidatus Kaiserbacteria bacterium]|nr:MAG: DUF192 domain-containing protein [Candidatus Kaiserbacteria bacterium]
MKRVFTVALLLTAVAVLISLVYTKLPTPLTQQQEQQEEQQEQRQAQQEKQGVGETVELDGQIIRISVADTDEERQLGLSGREGLAQDEGMLFIFPEDGLHAFWMKDMLFSIDILWLSAEGKIVHIEKSVSPDTFPSSFSPSAPARYVLELPAGFSERYTVMQGDVVHLGSATLFD